MGTDPTSNSPCQHHPSMPDTQGRRNSWIQFVSYSFEIVREHLALETDSLCNECKSSTLVHGASKKRRRSSVLQVAHKGTSMLRRFLVGDGGYTTCVSYAVIAIVTLIFLCDDHWTSMDPLVLAGTIIIIMLSRITTDASETGEKIFYALFLMTVCIAYFLINMFLDHDCSICMVHFPALAKQYVFPDPGQQKLDAFQLFADPPKTLQKCASCIFFFSKNLKWVSWLPEWLKEIDADIYEDLDTFAAITDLDHDRHKFGQECNEESCPAIENPKALSPSEYREIDEWYFAMRKASAPKDAFKKFVRALSFDIGSKEGKALLTNMTHDFLCYPTSRIKGPRPSEYLHSLKTPRFTGEEDKEGDGAMEIDFEKLIAILRGDKMLQLPADACAMIRLGSMLTPDVTVLSLAMSSAKVAPVANESTLLGHDAALLFPGLYVPKVDEDKDPEAQASSVTETLISLFQLLPIDDKVEWFDTREEYLAFFRFQIEHAIQEEYYFPEWLSRLNGTDGVPADLMDHLGTLVADQFRFQGDRQRIFEPTSDVTLADRAFYGAGVKSMTRIVLPSDPSYGYLTNPDYYSTLAEREFFKNKAMPSEKDLLRMVLQAWGYEVTDIETLRDKVVQIDYTIASHWEYRETFEVSGAILYLNAETRTVIGIWLCCREELVLPNAGMPWEHAKFIYRSSEVITASMMHVAEYHLGWAARFNSALRLTLPPSHGLRTLMKPYTHGTGIVNWNAYQMLVLEDSILARADGFTKRGRGHSWGHFVKHSDMVSTFPEQLEAKGLHGIANLTTTLPYFTQGLRLWNIHREYVEGFVKLIYGEDDTLFEQDDALRRFWFHINSNGRHLDPCICNMDAKMFYSKGLWPAFETTRTCAGLLDHEGFNVKETSPSKRRELWCKQTLPSERSKALYKWLESDCEVSDWCIQVSYNLEHLRPDFGLPELTRENLVRLITRFVWEVTAGHQMMADNIPFISDPYYGGVRRPAIYDKTKQPKSDISTYIFGTTISALTTIRSMPLLTDWSGLLVSWVDNKADWGRLSDEDRNKRKKDLVRLHLQYKSKLIVNANDFLQEMLTRPQNQWSPFLNPAVQAVSIAV